MDSKEIKPVHPKGNQPRKFTGKTDAEAEAPILWPPDAKSQLNGHEFEQSLGDSEGQGNLLCCGLWGYKELDTTEQLNNDKIAAISR